MARLRFTSSEATTLIFVSQGKESQTQIHYVVNLIRTISLFNRLTSQSASNKLFRSGIVTKFRFSKIIFTEGKIR